MEFSSEHSTVSLITLGQLSVLYHLLRPKAADNAEYAFASATSQLLASLAYHSRLLMPHPFEHLTAHSPSGRHGRHRHSYFMLGLTEAR